MRYQVGERFTFDDPDNRCFGCSPHNPDGLRIEFLCTGERTVEASYRVAEAMGGYGGVVHGGIQAALLDEVMGASVHTAVPAGEVWNFATAEMSLRYRRPVPTQQLLTIRGEWLRSQGRDYYAEGAILDASGEVLTAGRSRWRQLDAPLG